MDFTSFVLADPPYSLKEEFMYCKYTGIQKKRVILAFWAAEDTLSPILPLPRTKETSAVHLKKKKREDGRWKSA